VEDVDIAEDEKVRVVGVVGRKRGEVKASFKKCKN